MHERPIAKAAADSEPFLPLAMTDHIELILLSDAVRAFACRRAEQALLGGHTFDSDLDRDIGFLVQEARYRLDSYLSITGRDLMRPPRDRLDQLLRYIDKAGALLLAARERLVAIPPDAPEEESK